MSHVLVVEDSPTVSALIAYMLAQQGYETVKASDGEEAVRIATQIQPSLILLDVILPKMNGYQVCRNLKAAPETSSIPVVMLTSKAKESDRHWGMEQGADDYIVKPVTADALKSVIERFTN